MEETAVETVDTSRYKIPALTADNYYIWSHKMEVVLRGKGLWGIVDGTEEEPQEAAAKAKFIRRLDMALANIILTIDDKCNAAVITLRHPKAVWEKLAGMYTKVLDARIDAYLVQLQMVKMRSDEKVMEYVNRISELENKLAGVGHIVEQPEKKRVLLRGLREEFKVTAEVVRATDLDFDDAISCLVTAEAEHDGSDQDSEQEYKSSALTAHDHAQDHSKCKFCRKKGHVAQQCFFNPESPNYRPQLAKKRNDRRRNRNQKRFTRRYSTSFNTGGPPRDQNTPYAYLDVSLLTKVRGSQMPMPNSRLNKKWYIDSGASSHMCNDPDLFHTFQRNDAGLAVSVGDGKQAEVTGIGSVYCTSIVHGEKKRVELKDVLCVPSLMCNLVSVSRITDAGLFTLFLSGTKGNGMCEIRDPKTGTVYITGLDRQRNGLYEAVLRPDGTNRPKAWITATESSQMWHERLAHVSPNTIQKSVPMVDGIPSVQKQKVSLCETCEVSKSTRKPRPSCPKESRLTTKPLELVHVDIVGPIRHKSLNGSCYFMPIYDDPSALSLVRFLQKKKGASEAIKDIITELETIQNSKVQRLIVKRIRSDNAKEFLSADLEKWLHKKGIGHELSPPYSPESNGRAERVNRTLLDMARTMLLDALHLPNHKQLWAEAVNTANYIRNRLYSSASSDTSKTPYEIIMGKKPDLSHVRKFGAKSYIHIPKQKRKGKFDKRAEVGFCVGFTAGNSYKVYLPHAKKVLVSRDVTFEETTSSQPSSTVHRGTGNKGFTDPFESLAEHQYDSDLQIDLEEVLEAYDTHTEEQQPTICQPHENVADTAESTEGTLDAEAVTHYPDLRRSSREKKTPERFVPGM